MKLGSLTFPVFVCFLVLTTNSCGSGSGIKEEKIPTDSTFADTSQEILEDTALINYTPSTETFVDEGGETEPSKEKIVIPE